MLKKILVLIIFTSVLFFANTNSISAQVDGQPCGPGGTCSSGFGCISGNFCRKLGGAGDDCPCESAGLRCNSQNKCEAISGVYGCRWVVLRPPNGSCVVDSGRNQCDSATQEPGTSCSSLNQSLCVGTSFFNCVPKGSQNTGGSTTVPTCTSQGVTGIPTAIGCIPFGTPEALTTFFLRWALGIGGGIALLLIIYASFIISTSSGDPRRMQGGKELLTSAIAGLMLLIFSVFILRILGVNILGIF